MAVRITVASDQSCTGRPKRGQLLAVFCRSPPYRVMGKSNANGGSRRLRTQRARISDRVRPANPRAKQIPLESVVASSFDSWSGACPRDLRIV